ncbi:hypothetical protein EJ08DRAFT_703291 [Tothia fuscella]|uniref:NB-ARC domain-containing protein n=1 Tax=Tothia fuscella TaxID=1048955 RepID=A0A9P4NEP1_9PEZI|nr:hypothetical protein EJ08DRAFT_703291 [Tothia fuscella]
MRNLQLNFWKHIYAQYKWWKIISTPHSIFLPRVTHLLSHVLIQGSWITSIDAVQPLVAAFGNMGGHWWDEGNYASDRSSIGFPRRVEVYGRPYEGWYFSCGIHADFRFHNRKMDNMENQDEVLSFSKTYYFVPLNASKTDYASLLVRRVGKKRNIFERVGVCKESSDKDQWDGRTENTTDERIVLVHGIRGHPRRTWTAQATNIDHGRTWKKSSTRAILSRLVDGKSRPENPKKLREDAGSSRFWPVDFLTKDVENLRIISFGYDADVSNFLSRTSDRSIFSIAQDLIVRLEMMRSTSAHNDLPIIFIAHSLGGILVKDALKFSQDQQEFQSHLFSMFKSTYGVIFFGTPHRGSEMASIGKIAAKISGLGLAESSHRLLRSLEVGSSELERISDSLSRMLPKQVKGLQIYSFLEGLPLTGVSFPGKVVEEYSSIIGDAYEGKAVLQANHMDMCRYQNPQSHDYQLVAGVVRRWVRIAIGLETRSDVAQSLAPLAAQQTDVSAVDKTQPQEINLQAEARIPFHLSQFPSRHFCGRGDELFQIVRMFHTQAEQRNQRIVGLYGLGGVGKTQLALSYTMAHSTQYRAIFWVESTSEQTIWNSFRQIAQSIVDWAVQIRSQAVNFTRIAFDLGFSQFVSPTTGEISVSVNQSLAIARAVKSWLERNENREWLMIFDSADDLDGINLQDYFPNSKHGDILVTSRRAEISQLGQGLEIKCLEPTAGRELLIRQAQLGAETNNFKECQQISDLLGYLPLALAQAGSFIATTKSSPEAFLHLYRRQRELILRYNPARALWRYNETVFTTWEMSIFRHRRPTSRACKTFTSPWVYATREHLARYIYTRTQHQRSPRACNRDILETKSKFEFYPGSSLKFEEKREEEIKVPARCSSAHILAVQSVIGTQRPSEFNCYPSKLLIDIRNAVHPMRIHASIGEKVVSWSTSTIRELDESHPDAFGADLCHALGCVGDLVGLRYSVSIHEDQIYVNELALKKIQNVLGMKNQLGFVAMGKLSETYQKAGKFDDAIRLGSLRVELCTKKLGPLHHDTLMALSSLGLIHSMSGNPEAAREVLEEALERNKKAYGIARDCSTEMVNLGVVLTVLNRLDDAKELMEEAITMMKADSDWHRLLDAYGCIAWAAIRQNRIEESVSYIQEAIAVAENYWGPDSDQVLIWRWQLTSHMADAFPFDNEEAVQFIDDSIMNWITSYCQGSTPLFDVPRMHMIQANHYFSTGRSLDAKAVLEALIITLDRSSLERSNALADAYGTLALVLWDCGMLHDSLSAHDKSIAYTDEGDIDSLATRRLNRAVALKDLGRLDEAESIFWRHIEQNSKEGEASLNYTNLAGIMQQKGRHDEAMRILQRTISSMGHSEGASSRLLLTLHRQADLHAEMGNTEKAIETMSEAFEGKVKTLGICRTATLRSGISLQRLLTQNGRRNDAETIASRISPFLQYS